MRALAAWLSSSSSAPQQRVRPPSEEMLLALGHTSRVPLPQNTSGAPKAWDPTEAGAERHQSGKEKDPAMASKGWGAELIYLGNQGRVLS